MATKQPVLEIRDEIKEHLKSIERDWAWLSRKTEIPYATIYSIFEQRTFNLNQDRLDLINNTLETNFTLPKE